MKNVKLIAFLSLIVVNTLVANNKDIAQEPYISVAKIQKMNEREIDSMLPVLRSLRNIGATDKVITCTPELIKKAIEFKKYSTSNKFSTILGNALLNSGDVDSATSVYEASLEIAKKHSSKAMVAGGYINMAVAFADIGSFKEAIAYNIEAIKIVKELPKQKRQLFVATSNTAETYMMAKDYDNAQKYLDEAREILNYEYFNDTRDQFYIPLNYIQGVIHLAKEKPEESIEAIMRTMSLSEKHNLYLSKNYKILLDAHEKLGQYKEINTIRKKYEAHLKNRYKKSKIKQQQIATAKFEVDNYKLRFRESELENELSQQLAEKRKIQLNFLYGITALGIILALSLLYLIKRRNTLVNILKIKNKLYLEAKEESERLAQVKTDFLSTISHELRTPLYGIIGLTSIFLKDSSLKKHNKDLHSLKFSADYLLSLVNDVLLLNKNASSIIKEETKSNFSIRAMIASIVKNFEFLNNENKNEVEVSIDPDVPKIILARKTKITQVLMNLVSNASKFTKDGIISIEIRLKESFADSVKLFFLVKDTGEGIPEEVRQDIFKEFVQLIESGKQEGTGLGLPIVNAILKNLDSELVFSSEVGKGSEFSFDLTVNIGKEEEQVLKEENVDYDALKAKHILIVEDNNINQIVTTKILSQFEITSDVASSGFEALEMVSKKDYDLILMDINMPKMNGFETSKRIREFDVKTPIVALTATQFEDKSILGKNGINSLVTKPFKKLDLAKALLNYLN